MLFGLFGQRPQSPEEKRAQMEALLEVMHRPLPPIGMR